MLLANFKPKRTAAASRGFVTRFSRFKSGVFYLARCEYQNLIEQTNETIYSTSWGTIAETGSIHPQKFSIMDNNALKHKLTAH